MIPRDFITAWRAHAPWLQDAQVEQDLVISRALVDLFSVPELAARLAFRGGTALYKLYLRPAARYSEDIDLVQIAPEPIGDTLDRIRLALDPWLGRPNRKRKESRVLLVYPFRSEDSPPRTMRLKLEINSREHFSELGLVRVPLEVANPWFSGSAAVTTFELDELLGTKLRALYQRKKGRDLFDLWWALERGMVDRDRLLRCLARYLAEGGDRVSRAQMEAKLYGKARSVDFREDVLPLLRGGVEYDFEEALAVVGRELVEALPGEGWRGDVSGPR